MDLADLFQVGSSWDNRLEWIQLYGKVWRQDIEAARQISKMTTRILQISVVPVKFLWLNGPYLAHCLSEKV